MEPRPTPIVAGLGGAAIVAAVLSLGGHTSQPIVDKQAANTSSNKSSPTGVAFTSNQEGPWYAVCHEYATTEFDHGDDPPRDWGISGHHVPPEADEGTVEITRNIHLPGSTQLETEKFNVRNHTVGDLASCVPKGLKLRVLIATVPDPNQTQMPLEFDRDIQAIQSAAATKHYNYTRFWFPWRSSSWSTDKSTDSEAEARRGEEPGILCFRKNDTDRAAAKERLFVLLVGETPTSGVNRLQLAHALYYREQFRAQNQISDEDRSEVKIAGPHFSGSFPALQDVLEQAVYSKEAKPAQPAKPAHFPAPSVAFVSPDASGQELISEFKDFCQAQTPKCSLQTLSLDSGEVQSAAINYLRSLRYPKDQIAELTESESAFGASELNPLTQSGGKHWTFRDPDHVYGLSLHFPRDLSSVRSLSDTESAKIANSSSRFLTVPSNLLPTQLSVAEPIEGDSPLAFGREQEAAQVARSLDDSTEEMRHHRIRAVVISASNPLDRIYLLEYLHDQLPDVRTATVEADELELDRPHFVDLTGTIAVSALPSLPGMANVMPGMADGVKHTPPSLPMFKSSRQQGEFLAIEMLLDSEPGQKSESPNWLKTTRCYSISVVGEAGFQLIADAAQSNGDESATFPCLSVRHTNQPSTEVPPTASLAPEYHTVVHESDDGTRLCAAFVWFIVVLSGVHLFSVVQSRRHIEGIFTYPHRLTGRLEARRLYLLFVINNQFLLMDLLGVRLTWAVLGQKPSGGRVWLTVGVILLLASLVTSAVLMLWFLIGFIKEIKIGQIDRAEKSQLGMFMSPALVYLFWTMWMIWRLPAIQPQSGILLTRVVHLNDGLSPVMPIMAILLAYSLWSWVQLKRLDWSTSRKIDLDVKPGTNEYFASRIAQVMAGADGLLTPQPIVQVGSFVLSILAAVFLWNSLNGFDGLSFHIWMVVWGFSMLLLTVVTGCFHARYIWNELQKLLDWLETTSMREAFQDIGKSGLLSIKIWDLAKWQRSFTVLGKTVESLSSLYGPTSKEVKEAKTALDKFIKADAEGKQIEPGAIDELNRAMNVGVDNAVRAMQGQTQPQTTSVYRDELRLYLALRLVAFVRYTLLQVGTLISFVAYGFVLAVLSITFYAFEGRKTLGDLLLLTFLILLVWIAMMMVQFERNRMLSWLEGSTPGEASYLQVAFHLLTVGGLPLLAIVTAQFPSIASFVLLMFRPLIGMLH